MGFLFSKPEPEPPPEPKKEPYSPEVLSMLDRFNRNYPDLKFLLSSSNGLTVEKKKEFDNESYIFLKQVPVPTEDKLYTFLLDQIKKYSIKIKPTDEQVEKLLIDYSEKYPYMGEYLDNSKTLPVDKQVELNKSMQDFLEVYPLTSLIDFYKFQIILLKKYNLSVPPEEEGFSSYRTTTGINYSKISVKMQTIIKNRSLLEKEYSSFSR
jgi:hypothetical protein